MAGKEPEDYRPRRAAPRPVPGGETPRSGPGEPERSTTILPRVRDDRSTTILPRTADRRRRPDEPGDEMDVRPRLGPRARTALLVTGVVAVVVIGLVLGYVALNVGDRPAAAPSAGASVGAGDPSPSSNLVLLDDASMINDQNARQIDPDRSWQVASTQRGLDANSPRPACFASDAAEGQPDAQQTIQRLLASTGKDAPAVLHQAESYPTPEEAAQAYAVVAKTLGTCAVVSAFIDSGRTVTGLGDQATGAIVVISETGKQEYHSVVIGRTGRVLNVVDVAQPGSAADIGDAARALGEAIDVQCQTSGGACAENVSVKAGPPPLGGDSPGFLAAGDLPPVGESPTLWGGDPVHTPDPDFLGSHCETTDWSKTEATVRAARTYLPEGRPDTFGLDQIVITTESDKAAAALVAKVRKDLEDCGKRKATASVSKPEEVEGRGAENNTVSGVTATVEQQTQDGTLRYRVGIVAAGPKAVYTFLNPSKDLDFTDDQWATVVLRSGQRATQVQ